MSRKTITSVALLAALAVVGVAALLQRHRNGTHEDLPVVLDQTPKQDDSARIAKADAEAKRMADADRLKSGGTAGPHGGGGMEANRPLPSYGTLKPIAPDATPQVKSAVEAALSKTHPERLSCAIMPAKFDLSKWQGDPAWREAYLATPEPGRCYQSVDPGKDVPRISLACPAYIETLQGQPVTLAVRAVPGMPVTFTSFDAAMFVDTKLTTQTVVAGADGIASAQLLATPGVISTCRVRASCPVASGAAVITVNAKLPVSGPVATASSN